MIMEVYDSCEACTEYTDLVKWRNLRYVCNDCYNIFLVRAPHINGQHKTNEEAFEIIKQEILKRKRK